jgi:uncharacterized protein YkwD
MSSFSISYSSGSTFPMGFEQSLLNEINMARTDPKGYASFLSLPRYRDYPQSELQEARQYLLSQVPSGLLPFTLNPLLSEMAQSWVNVQGRTGTIGHGNLSERLRQANIPLLGGTYALAENIAYGFTDPRDIVIGWIVDYLVPDRGHRKSLFRADLNQIGIGYGPHISNNPNENFKVMVVNDYGSGFATRR